MGAGNYAIVRYAKGKKDMNKFIQDMRVVIGVDDCLHESYAMMNASIEVIEPHDFVIFMMVIICAFQNSIMAFTSNRSCLN